MILDAFTFPVNVRAAKEGASEVKTVRATNNNSTARVTALTPTSGKRVRVISQETTFAGATSNGLEIYFATGANIGTNSGKEIATPVQAASGSVFYAWPDGAGPVGFIGDVVSIRGTAAVADDVDLMLVYREE